MSDKLRLIVSFKPTDNPCSNVKKVEYAVPSVTAARELIDPFRDNISQAALINKDGTIIILKL